MRAVRVMSRRKSRRNYRYTARRLARSSGSIAATIFRNCGYGLEIHLESRIDAMLPIRFIKSKRLIWVRATQKEKLSKRVSKRIMGGSYGRHIKQEIRRRWIRKRIHTSHREINEWRKLAHMRDSYILEKGLIKADTLKKPRIYTIHTERYIPNATLSMR